MWESLCMCVVLIENGNFFQKLGLGEQRRRIYHFDNKKTCANKL